MMGIGDNLERSTDSPEPMQERIKKIAINCKAKAQRVSPREAAELVKESRKILIITGKGGG